MKPGDYVVISPGVWDAQMPPGRPDGLVLEVFGQKNKPPDQCTVLFSNGAMLKFHKSQLEVISETR